MKVRTVRLQNFRSFEDSGDIALGNVTVIVGRNNEGKSSILSALQTLQHGSPVSGADVRAGQEWAEVTVTLAGDRWPPSAVQEAPPAGGQLVIRATVRRNTQPPVSLDAAWDTEPPGQNPRRVTPFDAREPENVFHTYLSLRRVREYSPSITENSALEVGADLTNLYSKVARLSSPAHPAHQRYLEACRRVLGFVVAPFPVANGIGVGIHAQGSHYIPLTQMGAGVASSLGLIVDLCIAEGRAFLIEEPENDIHPRALKALLDLMLEAATANQFIVSTHSNIVLRHLGSQADAVVINVATAAKAQPPTSAVKPLLSQNDRLEALAALGYEMHDFGLADGWLLLEESSAQRLIRDCLIPWFAPQLLTLTTVASAGVQEVPRRFRDLHGLLLYLHLQTPYQRRAWVVVDGDAQGRSVVTKLRQAYASWPEDHFRTWSVDNFENFYPPRFAEEVSRVLALPHGGDKQDQKSRLLLDVLRWSGQNPEEARAAFAESAAEVIGLLRQIESQIAGTA